MAPMRDGFVSLCASSSCPGSLSRFSLRPVEAEGIVDPGLLQLPSPLEVGTLFFLFKPQVTRIQ